MKYDYEISIHELKDNLGFNGCVKITWEENGKHCYKELHLQEGVPFQNKTVLEDKLKELYRSWLISQ